MAEHFKSTSKTKDSDEVLEMYCEMCFKGGTTVAANGYCDTCMEYFCQTCARNHKRYLPTHLLYENYAMPSDICFEKCTIHHDELIKFFCETCGVIGCSVCKTENHLCKNLDSLKAITLCVKNFEKSELKSFMNKMDMIATKITTTKLNLEKDVKLAANTKEIVKKTKQAVCSRFDKFEDQMLCDIDKRNKNGSENLELVNKLNSDLGKISLAINEQAKDSQNYKMFIALKRADKDIEALETEIQKLETYKGPVEYRFKENPKLEQFKEAIRKLGGLGTLVDQKTATGNQVCQPEIVTRKKALYSCDISVKSDEDKQKCEIYSMCVLPDGKHLVASDAANSCIKLIDLSLNKVVGRSYVASDPFVVTAISNDLIAINIDHKEEQANGKIQFLHITRKKQLVFRKPLTTEMPCKYILHHGSSLFVFLTFAMESKVQRLDMKGRVLESYTIDISDVNFSQYGRKYLEFNANTKTIYVTDSHRKHLLEIRKGKVEQKKEYMFCTPAGMATDKHGSIYICEKGSYSVTVMNAEEIQKAQTLLTKEDILTSPCSIAYCKKNDKLYLAMRDENSIKVFDICEKKYKKKLTLEWTETLVEQ